MQKRGYIQVYTGDGKGKTTASLGLAMRALGHGWKVLIIQFTKGDSATNYGEIISSCLFQNLDVLQYGTNRVVYSFNQMDEDTKEAQRGWKVAKQAITENKYDMIILDELNVVLSMDMLDEQEVVSTIQNKPENMEIVLTGRYAQPSIINIAHLVTEMRPIKHYFDDLGVMAREGIEY